MRAFAQCLTPCGIVLLALPAFFLCMPDGIPFVYASCATVTGGTASSLEVSCTDCLEWEGAGPGGIELSQCTIAPTPSKCEISAHAFFTIDTEGEDCTVFWQGGCNNNPCPGADGVVIQGLVTNADPDPVSHGCSEHTDIIQLQFVADRISCNNCENSLGFTLLLEAEGFCESPP